MIHCSGKLLVIHGSRDPRTHQGLLDLAQQVRMGLGLQQSYGNSVETATLELGEYTLSEQIQQFGDRLLRQNITHLQIIPLFLLPGMHVMEDIPAQVQEAQSIIGEELHIEICPYLGSYPQLQNGLIEEIEIGDREVWIIIAHGSRRPGGNKPVETLAHQLGMLDAYWLVMPSLDWRIDQLMDLGYRRIGVLPYFLFPGYITDAISKTLAAKQAAYPQLDYTLLPTLNHNPHLAQMVLDLTVFSKASTLI
ncbi:sirohydrochlorin chelatase [Roseofilum sp. BLCC_M154]|uniref:Sirohydrochlorin chelatase n=1 Tax=Roseofilum acuticapitatum BLCC-M154 TaxID=3022444 RepID=A0ABT7AT83_9CYAN|nr:sirohydrochlorin chelatase [Roseofilum acuticapitatum]MDJ1169639.1 sirohydrochlorin chelatase [Roseofilum acuticapitatum BLCC-M154]